MILHFNNLRQEKQQHIFSSKYQKNMRSEALPWPQSSQSLECHQLTTNLSTHGAILGALTGASAQVLPFHRGGPFSAPWRWNGRLQCHLLLSCHLRKREMPRSFHRIGFWKNLCQGYFLRSYGPNGILCLAKCSSKTTPLATDLGHVPDVPVPFFTCNQPVPCRVQSWHHPQHLSTSSHLHTDFYLRLYLLSRHVLPQSSLCEPGVEGKCHFYSCWSAVQSCDSMTTWQAARILKIRRMPQASSGYIAKVGSSWPNIAVFNCRSCSSSGCCKI